MLIVNVVKDPDPPPIPPTNDDAVTAPLLLTLNCVAPPTWRSKSSEFTPDAVSVTFPFQSVNVSAPSFHVAVADSVFPTLDPAREVLSDPGAVPALGPREAGSEVASTLPAVRTPRISQESRKERDLVNFAGASDCAIRGR